MKSRLLAMSLLAVVMVFGGAQSAAAQDGLQLGASYDFFYREFEETSAAGAHFDVAKSLGSFSVLGEIGFNDYDGATVSSYQGGLRFPFGASTASARPFAQVTTGLWRCCDTNAFVLQPGAGVEFGSSAKVKYRVQFDYRWLRADGDNESAVRASAGVVFNLGN